GATGGAKWARAETTWMLYDTGEWDEVMTATDEVVAWVEAGGTTSTAAVCVPFKARVQLLRNNVASSGQIIQGYLPKVRHIGDAQLLAPLLTTAAMWEQAARNTTRAAQLAHEFIEVSGDAPVYVCWQLPDAARILVAAGELETVEGILERVRPGLTR